MNKKIFFSVISIIVILGIGIGVKVHMDNVKFHEEMVKVVKSDEGQKAIKKIIIEDIDKNAFTDKGKIHSFEIMHETIEHNPMGGISFEGYVNNDKKLEFDSHIDKYNGKLEADSIGVSVELQKLMGD